MAKAGKSKLLILYMKWGCPYCEQVFDVIRQHGLVCVIKNISHDPNKDELLRRGGKVQVPYLVDEWTGIEMYESEAIIKYLERRALVPSI